MTTRDDLAAYFESQSMSREMEAGEHSDDERNSAGADALHQIAEHIKHLPENDARFVKVESLGKAFAVLDASCSYPTTRIRFSHGRGVDPDRELTTWVDAIVEEQHRLGGVGAKRDTIGTVRLSPSSRGLGECC